MKTFDPNNRTISLRPGVSPRIWTLTADLVSTEPEYEEITPSELLEGDVVTHYQQEGKWWPMPAPAKVITTNDKEAECEYLERLSGGHCWLGHRGADKYRVRLHKDVAEEPKSDRWNGKCFRCGKGTYTGFSSVEHDGPCK